MEISLLNRVEILKFPLMRKNAFIEFEDVYKKIKRLIELSMLRTITLKKVTGWSKDNKRLIGKEGT